MSIVCFMRWMRHLTDVQLREQDKNKCLNEGDENAQRHEQDWRKPRVWGRQLRERVHDLLIGKHVSEETDTERERSNKITNQLNRENQPGDPPDRATKMFQMADQTVFTDADIVVIKKRTETECEGNTGCRSGRQEQGEQSHQVGN